MTWKDHITTERRMRRSTPSVLLDAVWLTFILVIGVMFAEILIRFIWSEEQIGTFVYQFIN